MAARLCTALCAVTIQAVRPCALSPFKLCGLVRCHHSSCAALCAVTIQAVLPCMLSPSKLCCLVRCHHSSCAALCAVTIQAVLPCALSPSKLCCLVRCHHLSCAALHAVTIQAVLFSTGRGWSGPPSPPPPPDIANSQLLQIPFKCHKCTQQLLCAPKRVHASFILPFILPAH